MPIYSKNLNSQTEIWKLASKMQLHPNQSSKTHDVLVLLLLLLLLKSEVERLRLLVKAPILPNQLRNILPNPPRLSLTLPLPTDREILLEPSLEFPPLSISVYTTGKWLSPANLPTANPPPGSLQMVKPTASSSIWPATLLSDDDCSEGNSWRHTGHEFRIESHGRMQSEW